MARTFLVVHQHLQLLGHPSLSEPDGSLSLLPDGDGMPSDRVINVLRILRMAHDYADFDRADDCLPPWHSQSTFQMLWRKMEAARLRNPDDMRSDISLSGENSSSLFYHALPTFLFSSLGWHCAVIILHRHLLAHISSWGDSNPQPNRGAALISGIFSSPPSPFLKEHIKIGLGSTVAVADICARVIDSGTLLLVGLLPFF